MIMSKPVDYTYTVLEHLDLMHLQPQCSQRVEGGMNVMLLLLTRMQKCLIVVVLGRLVMHMWPLSVYLVDLFKTPAVIEQHQQQIALLTACTL